MKSTAQVPTLTNRLYLAGGLSAGSYGMARNWSSLMERSDYFSQTIEETNYWGRLFHQPVEKPPVSVPVSIPAFDPNQTAILKILS